MRIKNFIEEIPTMTQSMPTCKQISLSILIPVYNERQLVTASLQRVLEINSPNISWMELIIIDDCSTDGTREILQSFAARNDHIKLICHSKNSGKGAAVRTALEYATGDVCIIHDADLEYNPRDIVDIVIPFIEEDADAVYGSRYLSASYKRVLMFSHTKMNKFITTLTNWFSGLNMSDVETCYKAIRTPILKSFSLSSNDFRLEIELTMKLAKKNAVIYEVPIRYYPRSYKEGKKIRPKDGILALFAILRYSLSNN